MISLINSVSAVWSFLGFGCWGIRVIEDSMKTASWSPMLGTMWQMLIREGQTG